MCFNIKIHATNIVKYIIFVNFKTNKYVSRSSERNDAEVEIFKNRFEFTYNRKLHIIIADKNSKSKIDNYSVQWKDEIDALGNHKITNKLAELQGIVLRAMHKG